MPQPPPQYAQRFARLPDVFAQLRLHPEGIPLGELAGRLGVTANELRADLLAFFTADLQVLLGMSRPDSLEFLGPDGADVDPNDAEIVRVVEEGSLDELGVEYVGAAELGLIYSAAQALLEAEPDNLDLGSALSVLAQTLVGEPVGVESTSEPDPFVNQFPDAIRRRSKVEIVYSRSWSAAVRSRVIDPYRLIQTRRGWEVDAGPVDENANLRTFLLSNVRSVQVLEDKFELPAEVESLLEAQRRTETVRVRIPHDARWTADFYAEQVQVVEDDEFTCTLNLDLLPPVDRRIGLLLLAAGQDAAVVSPANLIASVGDVARELLDHHRR